MLALLGLICCAMSFILYLADYPYAVIVAAHVADRSASGDQARDPGNPAPGPPRAGKGALANWAVGPSAITSPSGNSRAHAR